MCRLRKCGMETVETAGRSAVQAKLPKRRHIRQRLEENNINIYT